MIYHIPGRAAVSVTLETLTGIAEKAPNFVGMKHAVDDLGFVSRCLATLGMDFRIFVGLEDLSYPMMAVGACGLMNAVGNLRPARLAAMCEAVWEGDLGKARDIHYALFEINQAVFYDTNPIPIKYMKTGRADPRERAPPADGPGAPRARTAPRQGAGAGGDGVAGRPAPVSPDRNSAFAGKPASARALRPAQKIQTGQRWNKSDGVDAPSRRHRDVPRW